MMPKMRDALRGMTRRVTVQVIEQKVIDREAVQEPVDALRGSMVLTPMPARKIVIKPEGQRTWKWWDAVTNLKFKLGSFVKVDRYSQLFEVMELEDWSQAGIFKYQFAETPR